MKLPWLRYGNCLIGVAIIATALLLQGRGGRLRIRWSKHCWAPHLLYETAEGLYHFRTDYDLLPWPLCPLCFEGHVELKCEGCDYDFFLPALGFSAVLAVFAAFFISDVTPRTS